jgi:hypothetical protein
VGRYVRPVGHDSVPVLKRIQSVAIASPIVVTHRVYCRRQLSAPISAVSLHEEPEGSKEIQQRQRGTSSRRLNLHSLSYQSQASISKLMAKLICPKSLGIRQDWSGGGHTPRVPGGGGPERQI